MAISHYEICLHIYIYLKYDILFFFLRNQINILFIHLQIHIVHHIIIYLNLSKYVDDILFRYGGQMR